MSKHSIDWLLEVNSPSVRYWTLVDILDCPPDNPQVTAARQAVMEQDLVRQLFSIQKPGGFWGQDETTPYTANGAIAVLGLLYMLGVPPDERTAAGCNSLLENCQARTGGFALTRRLPSSVFPCTTGEHLPMLFYFGFGDDRRVLQAADFVIESMGREEALRCGRYQKRDCLWGAIAALKGLAVLPPKHRAEEARQTTAKLANALLDGPYDFTGEHKRWLSFGTPRAWDLLSALLALAAHGYAEDRRFEPLLERVLAQQDDQGRWKCGTVSRTWPIEKRGQPSKWVTLDALRLLKKVGRLNE